MKTLIAIILLGITSVAYSQSRNIVNNDSISKIIGDSLFKNTSVVDPKYIKTTEYPTFVDYLKAEIKAKKVRANGVINIIIMVNKDGSLSFIDLMGDIDFYSLEKLKLIINYSPKWSPATYNERPVKRRVMQKINFKN